MFAATDTPASASSTCLASTNDNAVFIHIPVREPRWQTTCYLSDFFGFSGLVLSFEVEFPLVDLGLVALTFLGTVAVALLNSGAVPLLSGSFVASDSDSMGIVVEGIWGFVIS